MGTELPLVGLGGKDSSEQMVLGGLRCAGVPLTPERAEEQKLWNRPEWSEKEEVRPPIEERVLRRKRIINDFKCPRGLI